MTNGPSDEEFERQMRDAGHRPNLEQLGFMRVGYNAGRASQDGAIRMLGVELQKASAQQMQLLLRLAESDAELARLRGEEP